MMQLHKILVPVIIILFLGCREKTHKRPDQLKPEVSAKENNSKAAANEIYSLTKMPDSSFVISCGSGCAMTYDVKEILGNLSRIEVKFSVIMFEDQEQVDQYFETFVFHYNKDKQLVKIIREGEEESFLETQMPGSQTSFKNFAAHLIHQMSIAKNAMSN